MHSTHGGRSLSMRGIWHRYCPTVPLGAFPLMYALGAACARCSTH